MFGEGVNRDIIQEYINNTTIEGLYTLESIHNLVRSDNKKVDIIETIYNIIYKNDDVDKLREYLVKKQITRN